MKKLVLLISAIVFLTGGISRADLYTVDPNHAEIGFSVKHMVITNVKGAFREYTSSFEIDANNKLKNLVAEVDVKSIDTRIKKRDDHLRSADFFEVNTFPKITFKTLSVEPEEGNRYTVTGELKIRDITKTVVLDGEMTGPVKDPWGNQRMGIVLKGQIDRKEFGLTYNKVLESGGLLIGDEVRIHLEGEGILNK